MDINSARAAEANGSMDKVAELLTWRDSTLFSEAERVALEYAERVTYTDQKTPTTPPPRIGTFPSAFPKASAGFFGQRR